MLYLVEMFVGENSTLIIALVSIVLFWIATYVCIKGVSWISIVTNLAGSARLFMGIAFVVLLCSSLCFW